MRPETLLPRHWPKRLCVVNGVLYGRFGQSRAAGFLCGAVGDAAQGNIVSCTGLYRMVRYHFLRAPEVMLGSSSV
eukprot:4680285-Prymnesium_polylepis.1